MEASASSNVACADTLAKCARRAHRGQCRKPRVARLCACACFAFAEREKLHTYIVSDDLRAEIGP